MGEEHLTTHDGHKIGGEIGARTITCDRIGQGLSDIIVIALGAAKSADDLSADVK